MILSGEPSIDLLGPFRLDQGPAAAGLPLKAQAVLTYLASHDGQAVPRDRLADLGWPRSALEQGRQSLRQALVAIRQALPARASVEAAGADAVMLKGAAVDLTAFERLARSSVLADLEAALALYRGPLLAGFPPVSPVFDEWLMQERARLAALAGRLMADVAELHLKGERPEAAIAVAQGFLALDNLREDAHRLLIRCYAAAGRRSDALRQYEACRTLLKRELGVAPDAATVALAEGLMDGARAAAPSLVVRSAEIGVLASASGPAAFLATLPAVADAPPVSLAAKRPDRPLWLYLAAIVAGLVVGAAAFPWLRTVWAVDERMAVTVEPFIVNSGEPKFAAVASNVSARLASGLSTIRTLKVVDAKTAFALTSRNDTSRTNPRWVISGTLQPGPEAWNIDARMVETPSGEVLWTDHFVVPNEQGDGTQNEQEFLGLVGDSVAKKMSELLTVRRHDAKTGSESQSLINQAQAVFEQASKDRTIIADGFVERALAIDPSNVEAQTFLAQIKMTQILNNWYTIETKPVFLERIQKLIESSIKIEPNYYRSRLAKCIFLRTLEKYSDSSIACDAALALNPWSAIALKEMGYDMMLLGQFDRAIFQFIKADSFDGIHAFRWTWLEGGGRVLLFLGRTEESINWLERADTVASGTGWSAVLLAAAYQRAGKQDSALLKLNDFKKKNPNATPSNIFKASHNTSTEYMTARARLFDTFKELGWAD